MNMGTSTTMAGMAMTTTSGSMASSTAMSSMDMDMDIGTCKVSMLWNWDTIDACFISTSWHITSNGMFAGSCIAVILLVTLLEFLRRSAKEYDRYIIRQFQRAQSYAYTSSPSSPPTKAVATASSSSLDGPGKNPRTLVGAKFRPNVMQQAIRAGLHMLQFTVAYFIMLLAMYYNGYFIICIIIGAFIGAFVFSWETIDMGGPQEEATVCCG